MDSQIFVLGVLVQCRDGDVNKKMPMLQLNFNAQMEKKECYFVVSTDMVEKKYLLLLKLISKKNSWRHQNFKTAIMVEH